MEAKFIFADVIAHIVAPPHWLRKDAQFNSSADENH
jgi:hypothetical protein